LETDELSCARDGVPTRLRCAKCGDGICPACMVRTPVGFDCPTCAGAAGGGRRGRSVGLILVAAAGVVLVALVGLDLARPSSTTKAPVDPVAANAAAPGQTTPTREPMMGEEARDGQLAFVVQDFSCSAGAAADRLCQLRLTVKNVSGGPALLLGRFQYLVDGQHKTYGPDAGLSNAVPDNANRGIDQLTVNPDVVMPLVLVYDVPDTVSPTEAQFRGTGASRFGINVRLERRS